MTDVEYFRSGVSEWTIQWDGGEYHLLRITKETVVRYPDGRIKVVLKGASIIEELLKDFSEGKLDGARLIRKFKAIPVEDINRPVGMKEIFGKIKIQKIVEQEKELCIPEVVILAERGTEI